MPYINKEDRKRYDSAIKFLIDAMPSGSSQAAGEFTYIIYKLLEKFNGAYYERAVGTGCLMMTIQEMHRREHVVYEDKRKKEFGDV